MDTSSGNDWSYLLVNPSRLELTVLYVLLGPHIILAMDAAIPVRWELFALISFLIFAIWFMTRLLLLLWRFRNSPKNYLRWGEGTAVILTFLLLHGTNLDVTASVYWSEQALIEQVRLIQRMDADWKGGVVNYGMFTVQNIYRTGESTVWLETVTGKPLFQSRPTLWAGLVFSEQMPPPALGESYYSHLYGPWWVWRQDA